MLVEKAVHFVTGKSLTQLEKEAFWRKKAEEARAAVDKVKTLSAEKLQDETDPEKAIAWQQEVADREAVALQAAERAGLVFGEPNEKKIPGPADDAEEKEPQGLPDRKEVAPPVKTAGRTVDILDIGTGSGAILLSLLKLLPGSRGLAVDISPDALAVAKENAKLLGVADRAWFLQSDIWSRMPGKAQFDIVVSNPPYIPAEVIGTLERDVQKEPRLALDGGSDGRDAYRKITAGMAGHIRPDGLAAFEVGIGQGESVAALCREQGFTVTAVVKDYAGIDRMVFAVRPDSAKAGWVRQQQK
ncbi:MAG: peptide chain release factor N(5)-glutamine methyltransferase [Acidaminococcaceae bacterium]|nr:peptide chain release factor N(5)-glutamine methyltransferase [Acidaminococcaceae bacterium]MBQ5346030.1 peptide chain release factor N(5)-glutamine methyltransferase [Acidaminococcaceae bacterium]